MLKKFTLIITRKPSMAGLSSSCDKSDAVFFTVMYLILEAINYYYYYYYYYSAQVCSLPTSSLATL